MQLPLDKTRRKLSSKKLLGENADCQGTESSLLPVDLFQRGEAEEESLQPDPVAKLYGDLNVTCIRLGAHDHSLSERPVAD